MDADNDRRLVTRTPQSAWWGTPARNTRDLATAAAPAAHVRPHGRARPRLRGALPDEGLRHRRHRRRRAARRCVPRLQRVLRRDLRALRRPDDDGRASCRCTRPRRRSPGCSTAPTSASRWSASPRASPGRSPSPRPGRRSSCPSSATGSTTSASTAPTTTTRCGPRPASSASRSRSTAASATCRPAASRR